MNAPHTTLNMTLLDEKNLAFRGIQIIFRIKKLRPLILSTVPKIGHLNRFLKGSMGLNSCPNLSNQLTSETNEA